MSEISIKKTVTITKIYAQGNMKVYATYIDGKFTGCSVFNGFAFIKKITDFEELKDLMQVLHEAYSDIALESQS